MLHVKREPDGTCQPSGTWDGCPLACWNWSNRARFHRRRRFQSTVAQIRLWPRGEASEPRRKATGGAPQLSKIVLFYRHEDGRLIEVRGEGARFESWLVYPHREMLGKSKSADEAKAALPEGFAADAGVFAPPCPKCNEISPMSLETGMYVCPDCGVGF